MAEEGKEILKTKIKTLKITLNESPVSMNWLVFLSLKTSLDLFYRVGIGTIDNAMLKDFASKRSNALMSYIKNKITRKANINKEDIRKRGSHC